MSAEEQMELVYHYLKDYKSKLMSQNDVVLAVFYPPAVGKGPDFNIADHYAYKGGRYPRGSAKYNSRYSYLKRLNGGIELAGDYSKKLSPKWKMQPKEKPKGNAARNAALIASIGTTLALLV
mgnify:CR=1 FL=1